MLPGWDRLQDLRKGGAPEPQAPAPSAEQLPKPDITQAVADAADRITAYRVVNQMARKDKMSLLGKLQHLTESAQDFHKETEADLDGIAEKIATGREKRKEAVAKHHAYYDTIVGAVEESTKVIDRLSNGPLSGDGEH